MVPTFTFDRAVDVHRLLESSHKGDKAAGNDLIRNIDPKLHPLVERRMDPKLRRRVDASDVVQDTLLASVKYVSGTSGSSYDALEYDGLEGLIRKILRRALGKTDRFHLRTERRAMAREVELTAEEMEEQVHSASAKSAGDSVEKELELKELQEKVKTAMQRLSKEDRKLIRLHYLKGWTCARVAQRLHISPELARKRLQLARDQLRSELASLGITECD